MSMAIDSTMLSCDPNTKVGCVIIRDDEVLSKGYNHLPAGIDIGKYNLAREGEYHETKYPYMLHGEAMAIVEAKVPLQDADMYVTLFPCNECAKLIIQAGIKHVYYLDDKYQDTKETKAAKRLLSDAGVKFIKLEGDDIYDEFQI